MLVVVVVFGCMFFSRKTDDESEQGMNALSIMKERRNAATSTRAKKKNMSKNLKASVKQ